MKSTNPIEADNDLNEIREALQSDSSMRKTMLVLFHNPDIAEGLLLFSKLSETNKNVALQEIKKIVEGKKVHSEHLNRRAV